MDLDIAIDRFRAIGCTAIIEFEESQDWLHRMPILDQGRFGAIHGLAGNVPMRMEPVWIVYHQDDAVLAFDDHGNRGQWGQRALGWFLSQVLPLFLDLLS